MTNIVTRKENKKFQACKEKTLDISHMKKILNCEAYFTIAEMFFTNSSSIKVLHSTLIEIINSIAIK